MLWLSEKEEIYELNNMIYFIVAFALSVFFTLAIRNIAIIVGVVDKPNKKRKKHKKGIPLLGGVAIFISFWLMVGYGVYFTDIIGTNIHPMHLLSVFLATIVLLVIGVIDDIKGLSPLIRIVFTALAAAIVIIGGVGLDGITNPFGGVLKLDFWQIKMGTVGSFLVLADLLVFFWLMGTMYTAKILDGLDGLTTGIVFIGAMMIFFLSSTTKFYQADTAYLALALAGVAFGFLLFNFNPAKIFLGESGGLFLGFMLGILAVIAGGKIATALLVMAVPILDLFYVIYKRITKKKSVFVGDRLHLHFRIVDIGLSQRTTVLLLYSVSFLFGITTLLLPSDLKILVLLLLVVLFLVGERIVGKKERR